MTCRGVKLGVQGGADPADLHADHEEGAKEAGEAAAHAGGRHDGEHELPGHRQKVHDLGGGRRALGGHDRAVEGLHLQGA